MGANLTGFQNLLGFFVSSSGSSLKMNCRLLQQTDQKVMSYKLALAKVLTNIRLKPDYGSRFFYRPLKRDGN